MDVFFLCQTCIVMGLPTSTKIYMKFTPISLLSGCRQRTEMKEKTSEQNASVEVPQMITSKTDLSIQKAYPWEMGNLDVEGGLHLTEDLGVNPVQTLCRAGVRFQQHSGEKVKEG